MPNLLQKLPVLVYVPAVPGEPGRAAYCVSVPSSGSATGTGGLFVGGSPGGYQPTGQIPPGWSGISDPNGYGTSFSGNRPVVHTNQVCYPAIPGKAPIPGRVDQHDNIGWNAGARSIPAVPETGFFRCTLPPSPIGVQVGFSGRLFQTAYSVMHHSLVVRWAEITVVEDGITVYGPVAVAGGAELELRRDGGKVTYLVDGSVLYQSEQASAGEVYGGVLLYSTTDYVDSPAIGLAAAAPAEFRATLPALRVAIGDEDFTCMRGNMPVLGFRATLDLMGDIQFRATLPALRMAIGDEDFTYMHGELPAVGFRAEAGMPEVIPNNVVALLPPLRLSATLLAGQAIEFRATLPALRVAIGDESFTYVRSDLPIRLIANIVEPYMPEGESDGSDAMFMNDEAVLETALIMIAMESVEVSSTEATLTMVLELASVDSVGISDQASVGWVIEMLAHESVAVFSKAESAQQQALQYAVNFMTGALTTYRDFDFLGFTYDDGHAYAWRKDGLYRLGGDTGDVINALVDFGASDYGDAHQKRMAMAFVGVRTDGECYLRLCADEGPERIYKLVGGSPQSRAALAKGVSGRTWNVRLELTDASYASVDNIELEIGASQRRGYGRRC